MPLAEALWRAKPFAQEVGVSRVTDITRLDRIGIPVFASVRPSAASGSLCVNAGKGLTRREARLGAYMEAIEFALAEEHASSIKPRLARARDVLAGGKHPDAILDLCPILNVSIALDERLPCVSAEDLNGATTLVPAELVFHPFQVPARQTYFGSSTNGLASGATLTEATVHALFEVIERDVASFEWLGRKSQLVHCETLPAKHRKIVASMRERGFEIAIQWLPNEFGIACFHALLWERERLEPVFITDGHGCHLDPQVALTRALTEAVQSRLTLIHGARDDIEQRHEEFAGMKKFEKRLYARRLLAPLRRRRPVFDFTTAPNGAAGATSLEDILGRIRSALAAGSIKTVLRVRLTAPWAPVSVVRVIVPLLEFFSPDMPRVGRRLATFASHV